MKKYSLLFVVLFTFACSFAQPSFVKDSLDKYVERSLKEWNLPGLAIAIVKDNEVILKSYGVKQLGMPGKVDENTLFMIGSNTKAMTGISLGILQEQKKLSLDDKVVKWLPNFTMRDPWVTKEINLRDIMSHRMGMETFQGDFMYWTSALTQQQVMEKFGKLTPMYGFRSKWGYTNAGFVVAGAVIGAASGKSWADFVTENIFKPLGMNNTLALSRDIPKAANKASAHTLNHEQQLVVIPFCDIDNLSPAGSVSSSVNDMSKWVQALLHNGKVGDKQVIPANAINWSMQPQSVIGGGGHAFNKINFNLYGLGWMLNDYNGKKLVSHTGGVNGFVTSVTLLPEEKLGIVVLTNSDNNALFEAVKWEILDAYLNLPYRNYAGVFATGNKQQMQQTKEVWKSKLDSVNMHIAPAVPLSNFAGQYQHEVYGWIKINVVSNHLEMSFEHHPNLKGVLEPLGGSRFVCTYNDPIFGRKILPFVIENGKVKSFTLRVADFIEFTTYEFMKL